MMSFMFWPFPKSLTEARLIRRYKRFLADVEMRDGEVVVAHCVNTGRMSGCSEPGSRVWLEPADEGSKRQLRWTWVLTETPAGVVVGVHTGFPNRFAAALLRDDAVAPLAEYETVRTEVKMGESSRVDVFLEGHATQPNCWVEVKNVTMVQDAVAMFPDAVTERGRKHLGELAKCVQSGDRAAMLYVIQRTDGATFRPADAIDPAYGETLRHVVKDCGVEAYALRTRPTPEGLYLEDLIPVELD